MADWRALAVAEALYFYALAPVIFEVLKDKLKKPKLFSFVYATGALLPVYVYTYSNVQWLLPVVFAHFMVAMMAKEDGYEALMSPYPYLLGSTLMIIMYLKSVVG
ncbi:hypothetical protein IPA_04965 [Ignicoccus pacificus DSM 13166]|uniref:Uncharacterized protein n=1 Tax=Ignicoccus pacificus DSM 13166 TaxID=940294 RepID=A0A977PLL3_9CREN|nr:hypothetical protein IPA_04965 [Ignicoccus pacificus DSM 13166]